MPMARSLALHRGRARHPLYRATIAAVILFSSSARSTRIVYPIESSHLCTSLKVYVPFTASPGITREAPHSLWYSSIMFPNPPPPCVQNGMIVLPLKSVALKNESTGGANVLSQLGDPIKTVSKSPTCTSLGISAGQTPFSICALTSFTAVLYEKE